LTASCVSPVVKTRVTSINPKVAGSNPAMAAKPCSSARIEHRKAKTAVRWFPGD
jgi:hypothetical protein